MRGVAFLHTSARELVYSARLGQEVAELMLATLKVSKHPRNSFGSFAFTTPIQGYNKNTVQLTESYEFRWLGFSWISVDFHGFLWIPIDFCESLWIPV